MSNNDSTCQHIESTLHSCQVYLFNPDQHHLLCLAHVVNLTVTVFMGVVTKIAHVEMTTVIWEFNSTLPENKVLSNNSIDIVVSI